MPLSPVLQTSMFVRARLLIGCARYSNYLRCSEGSMRPTRPILSSTFRRFPDDPLLMNGKMHLWIMLIRSCWSRYINVNPCRIGVLTSLNYIIWMPTEHQGEGSLMWATAIRSLSFMEKTAFQIETWPKKRKVGKLDRNHRPTGMTQAITKFIWC